MPTLGRRPLLQGLLLMPLVPLRTALAAVPSFTLEDQWERPIASASVFESTVILVGGDQRHSGDRAAEWLARLGGVRAYGIADLDSVPFFIPRGAIRKDIRASTPTTSVLLDWKGAVYAPILGFPKGQEIVVQVHASDGTRRARFVGPVTDSGLAEVRRAASS